MLLQSSGKGGDYMLVLAFKVSSDFKLLYYRSKGLHYIKVLGTTILVYGRTIDEVFQELLEVLEDINSAIRSKEIDPKSLVQEPSLTEKILYIIGRFMALIVRGLFKTQNIQKVDSELRMMHA